MKLFELQEKFDIDTVKRECAEWFKVCPSQKLYHGTQDYDSPVAILKLNKKRNPSASSRYLHDAVNDFFEEKIGWRVREDGLFCSGDEITGSVYSKASGPHIAIPIGKFDYIWSAEIPDMYAVYTNLFATSPVTSSKYEDLAGRQRAAENATIDKIKNVKWHLNEGIVPALKLKVEIIIRAHSFYLMRPDSDLAKQIYGKER